MLPWVLSLGFADPGMLWRDMLPPATVTVQSNSPSSVDLAPAAGPDVAVVVILVVVVVGVGLIVLRSRRHR
jgi:hypothetical protein